MSTKQGAALLSIFSNTTLVVLKLVVGILGGSVSVISEAAHSGIDLIASFIAFFSVRASDVPPDEQHPYGHGKIENVSGVVEALLIFVAAGWIVYEAINRMPTALAGKLEIEPTAGILVMGISVAANYLISGWLFKISKLTDSVALEADGHHLRTDVWTSIGVFVGLAAVKILNMFGVKGAAVLDSGVALGVAILILRVAYDLTKTAGRPLMDVRLPDDEHQKVVDILNAEVAGDGPLVDYHKLRTRKSGAQRHIDVHLIVKRDLDVEQAHDFAEQVEDSIRSSVENANVVTHVEPDTDDNLNDGECNTKNW